MPRRDLRDGDSRLLRVIGHLLEAAEESQEWPELHDAIREARRACQRAGGIPDFEAMAATIAERRSG